MRAWNQNRLFNYVIPQVMKKNWLQTTANEIVIMVLIHLPNSKNLSNLIKSEFCPLFKLSLLVFLVSKIENLCCSVELPCVSYHWELSSIKISKISFFEFLDIFHQNQPEWAGEPYAQESFVIQNLHYRQKWNITFALYEVKWVFSIEFFVM